MPKGLQDLRDEALFWGSVALMLLLIPMNWQNLVSHPVALVVVTALTAVAATIAIWDRYSKRV